MDVGEAARRAQQDIAEGDVQRAINRLRALVLSRPTDLDVRTLLADAYRTGGNPVEAGRWSYLNEVRKDREVGAFEHAYGSPIKIMRSLRWSASEAEAGTETARERLRMVRENAEKQLGRTVVWEELTSREYERSGIGVAEGIIGAILVSALLCTVLGVVVVARTVLEWLF